MQRSLRAILPSVTPHDPMGLVWLGSLVFTVLGAYLLMFSQLGSWQGVLALPDLPLLLLGTALLLGWGCWGVQVPLDPSRRVLFMGGCWGLVGMLCWLQSSFAFVVFSLTLQAFLILPARWFFVPIGVFVGFGLFNATQNKSEEQVVASVLVVLAISALLSALLWAVEQARKEARENARLLLLLEKAQQDLREQERERGALAERARLSRELHDTLAQGFAGVVTQLTAAELALDAGETLTRRHLQAALGVARAGLSEIRQVMWDLRPAELQGKPSLEAALDGVMRQWQENSGVQAVFACESPLPSLRPEVEVTLLRVLQEALQNVSRHARATEVQVRLGCAEGLVMLDVEDNGTGFPPGGLQAGLGLRGMTERVQALGGQVMWENLTPSGVALTAAFDLSRVVSRQGAAS